jgi:hypothetical protein
MKGNPRDLCDFCGHERAMHHDQEKCVYCVATKRHASYCEDGVLCCCIAFVEPGLSDDEVAALTGATA